MSYEAELLALAVLLYLYDSSVLLYSNEGVLTCDRGGQWSMGAVWTGFMFAGRSLCMLNPFTPHRPAFRLSWDFESLPAGDPRWSEHAEPLTSLGPLVLAAAIALFVMLPIGLLTAAAAYAIVPAVVLLYGSIIAALIRAYRQWTSLGGGKRFLGFAFECLACPPFGVNMIRRMALAEHIAEPLPVAGSRLLDAPHWVELRARCLARLEEVGRGVVDPAELETLSVQKRRLEALDRVP